MSRIIEWIKQNRRLSAVILVHILFLSFFMYFTSRTGMFNDDYGYMYMFSREDKLINDRVDSIAEVFRSQYEHYFIMNGRSVAHTLLQTVLMLGKGWFCVLNTAVYFLLSFSMYQLVRKKDEHSPLLQILVYLVPWVMFAEYGKVLLVSYLSVNYLWSIAFIAAMLVPFKKLYDGVDCLEKMPELGASLMLAAGIVTGWLSENGSAAMLFIVGCMGLYYLIARKKIPVWCITGFVGMLIGFLAMLLAPGYDVRQESWGEYSYVFQFMKISVYHVLPYFWYILAALLCVFGIAAIRIEKEITKKFKQAALIALTAAVLFGICFALMPAEGRSEYMLVILAAAAAAAVSAVVMAVKKGECMTDLAAPAAFMVTGFVATYAMIASPMFETRSELPFLILFSCGALYVICQFITELSVLFRTDKIKPILLAAASIYAVVSLCAAVPAVNYGYEQFKAREELIAEQKAAGNNDVVLPAYDIPENIHVGLHNMGFNDPEYWLTEATCWYYGVDSVTYELEESPN